MAGLSTSLADDLRALRAGAGLTQAELARRAGTSQATVSQYERGRKVPGADTLARLVAATGSELRVDATRGSAPDRPVLRPTAEQLRRAGRQLEEVIALAALLPTRHAPTLPVPPIPRASPPSST
jgi:transcriptional regulator with XRE-family HTH domain